MLNKLQCTKLSEVLPSVDGIYHHKEQGNELWCKFGGFKQPVSQTMLFEFVHTQPEDFRKAFYIAVVRKVTNDDFVAYGNKPQDAVRKFDAITGAKPELMAEVLVILLEKERG